MRQKRIKVGKLRVKTEKVYAVEPFDMGKALGFKITPP